jgi:hypothetical protein
MAVIKISELSALATASLNTIVPAVSGGTTYKLSLDAVKTTMGNGGFTSQMFINPQTITSDIDIPASHNAFLLGPIDVDGTVAIGSGSNLSIFDLTGGGSGGNIDTSAFATTGSNTFIGNQTITGSVDITGSLTVNTVNVGQNTLNFIDTNGSIINSISIQSGSNNVVISTGSLKLNGNDVARPYKVYTALLTQSGGDEFLSLGVGDNLQIGVTYQILDDGGNGWDFTNVGAPNNNLNTYFVATGTTPNSWGTGVFLEYNTGAPVVTVLENTIGNVYWSYSTAGGYTGTIDEDLVTEGKQAVFSPPVAISTSGNKYFVAIENSTVNGIVGIYSTDGTDYINDGLVDFPIEIRVYN